MTVIPIIAAPEHQRGAAQRLADHCQRLDGTTVQVIPIPKAADEAYSNTHPNAPFPCLQAFGLRYCAEKMRGKPFFWLEHDSIPLKQGWLKTLTEEYQRHGKPYLISSDCNAPNDLVGGIGIYGPDTHWLIPDYFPSSGWDLWMVNHLKDLIAKTPLIQHSYGNYNNAGVCTHHLFPAERWMIRDSTLVFHRDRDQGLIAGKQPDYTFVHSGDLGDIVAALPIIRQLGGGRIVMTDSDGIRPMSNRMHLITPLLEGCPYIKGVSFEKKASGNMDFTKFRKVYRSNRTLTESQADWLGIKYVNYAPWLKVKPCKSTSGRVVVCRSPRYHNHAFPWRKIIDSLGKKIVFVGLDSEHADFCHLAGFNVERHPTKTLLEVAEAIAGSELFIGNQSSPCWIAMAMGHPLIQESHPQIRDSIVERPNARFVHSGIL